MSYVDEVIEQVVAQNPAEPEFHQAVKEVLESLRAVVEANEEAFSFIWSLYIFICICCFRPIISCTLSRNYFFT